jgi:predicted ester cyclase
MTAPVQDTRNKVTFRRLLEAANSHDRELVSRKIDDAFHPGVLIRTPLPVQTTGAQAFKDVFAMLHRAFPDLRITVDDVIEEGDTVVCRNTVTGTHLGPYMGLAPTRKSVAYNEVFILRFVDGRIAEIWGIVDVFSQMKQLGLIQA